MSKSFSKARVSLTNREMKERSARREFKTRNARTDSIEILDRRFDYQQSDIYEMLNIQQSTHYVE